MNKEDKELLLQDLCARLPYHPNCYCKWLEKAPNGTNGCIQELSTFVIDEIEIMDDPQFKCQICDVKPYLRPLSSMTEKEMSELRQWGSLCMTPDYCVEDVGVYGAIHSIPVIDWLNAHHFDYRGMIEKGLALPAKEGMY